MHQRAHWIIVAICLALSGPAMAKKPDTPPGHSKAARATSQDGWSGSAEQKGWSGSAAEYFTDERRAAVRNYYSSRRGAGSCPPGLAKKRNGCRPPGQVKQWRRGQPLPPDVVYYDVPSALLHELGRTPEGQKIVRVGTDLLLIAVGTGMVIDALEDLDDVF